jgi:hypothetical protein
MGTKHRNSISEQLTAAQVAVTNTLADAELQARVTEFGYTASKINEGKALYDTALNAVNAQVAAAGAQYQSTAQLVAAEANARDAYQALAKVARAVFAKEPTRLSALGLAGTMPRSTAEFLPAAYTMFDNAQSIPEIASALEAYGYKAPKLQSERAKIAAYEAANQVQESAKGTAQQATREQDTALAAMNEWVAQYIKIAKVALRDKKQLLEKIGVTARTSKTAAQRNAPKKAAATRAKKKTGTT